MKKGLVRLSMQALLGMGLAVLLLVPTQALAGDWPQFHGDPQHTGYSASPAPHTAHLLWESPEIGAVDASSLAIAEGKVFVNCGTSLVCLDETSGSVLWSQPIVGGNSWGSWAGPAYDDGRVFISGSMVYAFNAADGAPLWTYDLPHDACNGGPLAVAGRVYASDWDGHHYYCLDAATGALLWSFDVGSGYAQGVPAFYDDGAEGRIFLTSWSSPGGHVWCLNAATGDLIWHGVTPLDTCGSPTIAEGKVWVTTYNFSGFGSLLAFDINDLGGDGIGDIVWGPISIERTNSTPAYWNGKIYVSGGCYGFSNEGERTYCIDIATESILWQTPVEWGVGNWTCSVAVADGLVFSGKPAPGGAMAFDYEAIYALDAVTGAEIWHYDHGGASPSVANGRVFTVAEGKIWAFQDATAPAWDVNGDGSVNVLDMVQVGLHFGESGTPGWIREDVNADGAVNVLDLVTVGLHFGE